MHASTAKEIARIAHFGQSYGTEDYFETHVSDVARRVSNDLRADDQLVAIAWLHDVIEDSEACMTDLDKDGLTRRQHLALLALSRWPDEDYKTYITRVLSNRDAALVKFHDLRSNMASTPTAKQLARYTEAFMRVSKYLERNHG